MRFKLVFLVGLLFCLAACDRTSSAAVKTSGQAVSKLIYRPNVKLTTTDSDPDKLKTLLIAWKEILSEDYDAARKTVLPLANAGYTDAQLVMAFSFMPHDITHPSKKTTFDWRHGIPWMKKAADNGNARAQYLLGDWYYHGFPGQVYRDYFATDWDKVNYYLHAAAEQGLPYAQLELGTLYESAHGVPMDPKVQAAYLKTHKLKAYMWFSLASNRFMPNTDKGINRKAIAEQAIKDLVREKSLTPEEVAEGERLTAQWIKTHPDAYRVEYPSELYPDPALNR